MVLAAATALSLGACAEGEDTNKKPINPNAPDYSDSTLQMDFYGYSPPTDGTYTLDGQTFTTGEDYRTPERYKEYMDCGMTILLAQSSGAYQAGDVWETSDAKKVLDAAYEAYIQEDNVPHSIYEIRGAKKVAIEIRSFSKTAGFTGVRCGYTVVPKELTAATLEGERIPLNSLWNRRQCTKFNGTSYITQRAAEAIYTPEGKQQVKANIDYYMQNAATMRKSLETVGLKVYGGVNAPYLWLKTPDGTSSWRFFEQMLYKANVVGTPGVGFGPSGEGFLRLTAFGTHADCEEAMKRIRQWLA